MKEDSLFKSVLAYERPKKYKLLSLVIRCNYDNMSVVSHNKKQSREIKLLLKIQRINSFIGIH